MLKRIMDKLGSLIGCLILVSLFIFIVLFSAYYANLRFNARYNQCMQTVNDSQKCLVYANMDK